MGGRVARWLRIDREVVFRGRIVEVWRDRVRIARGEESRETVYDLVHHPGAVGVVALYPDGSIVLVRQFRYTVGAEIWEIPAGTLESGESYEACAERELAEEIGCRAARWTALLDMYTTPGFCDEAMRIYLAEELSDATGTPDDDEDLEVARVSFSDALARAAGGEIRDAKTLVALHVAREHLAAQGRWPAGVE